MSFYLVLSECNLKQMLQIEFLFSIFKDVTKYHSHAKLLSFSVTYVSLQCLSSLHFVWKIYPNEAKVLGN